MKSGSKEVPFRLFKFGFFLIGGVAGILLSLDVSRMTHEISVLLAERKSSSASLSGYKTEVNDFGTG